MARQKEYIREEVINAATKVFWARGFKGTSVSDLVGATGLNKHSMYQEFGSKEGLYHECLDNFTNKINWQLDAILTRKPLGLQNIKDFFRNRIEYASSGECHGCMLVNATVEKELLDDDAIERTQQYLSHRRDTILECLKAAQKTGEVNPAKDPDVLADYLLSFLTGIMVVGKTNPTRKSLEAATEVAFSSLK